MSREVRRVPADWKHPARRTHRGVEPIPLLESECDPIDLVAEWVKAARQWEEGEHPDQHEAWAKSAKDCTHYWDWDDDPPRPSEYMPNWPKEQRTHYQMYECTSEGTPISPVMETPEELAKWLVDNKVSAFADMLATYEQWLAMIKSTGSAPSMVLRPTTGEMQSGVAAITDLKGPQ